MSNLSIKEIIKICQAIDFFPRRSSGQNFLFKEKIIKEIVAAAGLSKKETVLEIGPGLGFMTEEISNQADCVVAVELDKRLAGYLAEKFAGHKNIKIINEDIFKVDLKKYFADLKYTLISNLPYNITSLVLRNFLSRPPRPRKIILTVQKEVAERITAQPGQMSILSVITRYYSRPSVIKKIGPENFWPAPKVDSALIKLENIGENNFKVEEENFLRLVKIGFSAKRKKLSNNLKNGFEIPAEISEKILKKMKLRPDARPQMLSLANWLGLWENLFDGKRQI